MKRLIPIGASALVACALLVPSAVAVSVMDIPTVLPPESSGDWPTCASPEEQMCIDSVSVQVGGQDVDYVTAGLAAHVSTLDGYVSSFNWSIQGSWNLDSALPQGFDPALLDADLSLVIRVGAWVPRMTSALAKDLRITVLGDDITGRTLTLSGKPIHIDWDPTLSSCYSPLTAGACGDDTTRATDVGSGWRFMGNTQDMGTWSEAEQSQRGGMYVATDAQGGPHMAALALQFTTYPEPYWELKLGNPHLDVNGNPVRGSFNAWLPESYFTSLETTVDAAIATGFSVASAADGVTTLISPDVSKVDGGVMISLVDIGYSVRTLTVRNEPVPPLAAPGVPTQVQVSASGSDINVTWAAPADGGAVAGYTASVFAAATDGQVIATCTSASLLCTVDGSAASLAADTSYYVSVHASNVTADSAESDPRVEVVMPPTLAAPGPPLEVVVAGDVGSLNVSWLAPESGGSVANYTATAYTAATGGSVAGTCTSSSATLCNLRGPQQTALPDNTAYYVSVVASNLGGDSSPSAPRVQGKTMPTKPVLTKSLATSSVLSFTFTRQRGVTYTAVAKRGNVAVLASRISVTQTGAGKVTIAGLAPGTPFSVTLRASNDQDHYISSNTVTHTTLVAIPSKVTGLAASKIKNGKVTLTWDAVPETGAPVVYRYRWVKKGSTAWSSWVQVSVLKGVVSWVKGTQYSVQILARNTAGDASTASAIFTAS